MIIIELTYIKPLSEVEKYLEDHRNFLKKYYENTFFFTSGAKIPRTGGIILANLTLKAAKQCVEEDPFYKHGVAQYNFIEFNPTMTAENFNLP